ncbi:MAG: cytidylate kinase-like family protein [Candidatus Wallbacteria bacterium]|nr:cytidylate kinase-like family protein [Candidatus Wallbacteria bacterium]
MTKRVRHDIHELIDRQVFRWHEDSVAIGEPELPRKPADQPKIGPYVTISRDFGCGALVVAAILSEKLGWQVYDREIIDEVAQESRLRRSVVESHDERVQNWIVEYVNNLTFMGELSESDFFHHFVRVVTALGTHGKAILVGRGTNFVLPADRGVRVRLVAPFEMRARWVAHRNALDLDEARRFVSKTDADRAEFVRRHFHRDVADASAYDRIFDVSQINHDAVAGAIVEMLERKLGIYAPGRSSSVAATPSVL